MILDLNEFHQEIHSWKSLLKQKDEEIRVLQQQLSFTSQQNEVLEVTCTNLLGEISELNNAVSALRNSFSKIDVFEEDRRKLQEEKQKLKNSLESLEKLYYEKNKNLTQELQKIKEANKDDTSKLVSQIKNEASKQLEIIKEELDIKKNYIKELKTQMTKLLEERDQDILKMKIQYEDKIGKMKQQMPKFRISTPHGLQMHDIFRQKYLKLEKDSEEKITQLNEQIQTLQQLIECLKSKSGSTSFGSAQSSKSKSGLTSLSSALLAPNKPNIYTIAEVATQTENAFTEVARQFISQVPNDSADFVTEKKINKTKSIIVLPQKRKLFNLNENYYVKNNA